MNSVIDDPENKSLSCLCLDEDDAGTVTDIDKLELNFLKHHSKYDSSGEVPQTSEQRRITITENKRFLIKFSPLNILRKEEEEAEMQRNLKMKTLKFIEASTLPLHPRSVGGGDHSEVSSIVDENMSGVTGLTDDIKVGESATDWQNCKFCVIPSPSAISINDEKMEEKESQHLIDLDQDLLPLEFDETKDVKKYCILGYEWAQLPKFSTWTPDELCFAFTNIFLSGLALAVIYKLSNRHL